MKLSREINSFSLHMIDDRRYFERWTCGRKSDDMRVIQLENFLCHRFFRNIQEFLGA